MKSLRYIAGAWMAVSGILAAAVLFTGCRTEPSYVEVPGMPDAVTQTNYIDAFHVGETVLLTFSGPGKEEPIPSYTETIKEDGMISPPQLGVTVKVAGKTPGMLQNELQEKYRRIFNNIQVTVKAGDRFFTVNGEVRNVGPKVYLGRTDIVTAISAAGGFTDFANKKKVRLTRANGHTQIVNVARAIVDPLVNVPIYPGDNIFVPRRFW